MPDDLVWLERHGTAALFFTDLGQPGTPRAAYAQLPNAVWRYTPHNGVVTPVIARNDVAVPNGIRTNKAGDALIISDFSPSQSVGPANASFGNPALWTFDIDDQLMPRNRRLLSLSVHSAMDGIHLDDHARIWTAEADGIYIRDRNGIIEGFVNGSCLIQNASLPRIANFALAGNKLIILAQTQIWAIDLEEYVVRPGWLA
ncbi:hypothetical protein LTR86_011332 [Recurvomyces mirabilis]|nr:hypothetical protein LTR86_011332 [Recurvomyces mirabilis]